MISAAYRLQLMDDAIRRAEKHAVELAKVEAATALLQPLLARLAAVRQARDAYRAACRAAAKAGVDLDTNIAEIGRQVKRLAGLWTW